MLCFLSYFILKVKGLSSLFGTLFFNGRQLSYDMARNVRYCSKASASQTGSIFINPIPASNKNSFSPLSSSIFSVCLKRCFRHQNEAIFVNNHIINIFCISFRIYALLIELQSLIPRPPIPV